VLRRKQEFDDKNQASSYHWVFLEMSDYLKTLGFFDEPNPAVLQSMFKKALVEYLNTHHRITNMFCCFTYFVMFID
jgi:hypothetical protein